MEERQLATRKIIEKMKQDENLRSFEGSSGALSDGDDLEDTEEEEEDNISVGEQGDVGGGVGAKISGKSINLLISKLFQLISNLLILNVS